MSYGTGLFHKRAWQENPVVLNEMERIVARPHGEAEALPFEAYHDPDHFELEQREIFGRDWVFVCMEADLPDPGDYQTLRIGDEPVVVLRGSDGALRALSNVCRHRGAVMLKGAGNARNVVCPYHAWTYTNDGALRGVPFPGEVRIDKRAHGLPRFRLECWLGFVFVSLNDAAPPLEERFRGLETHISGYGIPDFRHTHPIAVQRWQANWKLAIENFVEGYHFFAVHANTVETAARTRDCFYVEGRADWSITGGHQLDDPITLTDWLRGKPRRIQYLSICLPPNLVCNLYDGYMTWARVLPTSSTTCEIAVGTCADRAFEVGRRLQAFTDETFSEDREICESVQRGVTSRRSSGGRLVELERAVVDFHHYLGKRLFGKDPSRHHRSRHAESSDRALDAEACNHGP